LEDSASPRTFSEETLGQILDTDFDVLYPVGPAHQFMEQGDWEVLFGDELDLDLLLSLADDAVELEALYDDDGSYLLDFSEEEADVLDWQEDVLLRFAEWFGYQIDPNPESVLGFRVVAPSGNTLGGFVARQIIEAYKKNPTAQKGAGVGGKAKTGKGKAGGGGAAKKAGKTPEQALAETIGKAVEGIDDMDIDTMAYRSKGKLDIEVLGMLADGAKAALAQAKDPGEVKDILKRLKKDISAYKYEMTKGPSDDEKTAMAIQKMQKALPDPGDLGGDVGKMEAIVKGANTALGTARTPEEAKEIVAKMRKDIAAQKKADAAVEKAAKTETGKMTKAASGGGKKAAQHMAGAGGQEQPTEPHQRVQLEAHAQGWDVEEVIKAQPEEAEVYKQKIQERARSEPTKLWTIIPSGGILTLVSKPREAFSKPVAREQTAETPKQMSEWSIEDWADYYAGDLVGQQ
jgi:hypothetical protein